MGLRTHQNQHADHVRRPCQRRGAFGVLFKHSDQFVFCSCRYEQSEWGWKEREKREEMNDERAWYLLARDGDSNPLAFSHFRFDVECGEEVLYW